MDALNPVGVVEYFMSLETHPEKHQDHQMKLAGTTFKRGKQQMVVLTSSRPGN